MFLQGVDLNEGDYDGRTALHICVSEGHLECTKFLVNVAKVKTAIKGCQNLREKFPIAKIISLGNASTFGWSGGNGSTSG